MTMNISLTPQLEKSVRLRVESGRYASASEVIRDALRLLDQQDQYRAMRLEELRKEVMLGVEQAERGECSEFTAETLHELRERGLKRLKK
jgi:antitoxin ParD1/3/4